MSSFCQLLPAQIQAPVTSVLVPDKLVNLHVNMLRLDQIHPTISGNKWLKLALTMHKAQQDGLHVASFGGPYSNHLHAFSYAASAMRLSHTVFVRGLGCKNSRTLEDIRANAGQVVRLSRRDYAKKHLPAQQARWRDLYGEFSFIPEGGNSALGVAGVQQWLVAQNLPAEAQIAVSVGSGCTLQGLLQGLTSKQHVFALPAYFLQAEQWQTWQAWPNSQQMTLINAPQSDRFAQLTLQQKQQIQLFKQQQAIALDPVYTGKTWFRWLDFIQRNKALQQKPLYFLHTGGLQGWNGVN